jgi:hypothetical protein
MVGVDDVIQLVRNTSAVPVSGSLNRTRRSCALCAPVSVLRYLSFSYEEQTTYG